MPLPTSRARSLLLVILAVFTAAVAIRGWQLFFFTTDDAYMSFRYASNSLAGRGLVWNPAPFRPVEGYSSFLWVMLLREVWSVTGFEPPDSANVLSLCCALGTLLLTGRFLLRMQLPARLEEWRLPLLVLVLLGTVTNRTFLAWTSSGMQTALFNLLLTWWIYEGTAPGGRDRPAWILRLSLSAALCALCQTDGLLAVVATPIILLLARTDGGARRLGWAFPLLLVPAHLVWRRLTYGDWLSNAWRASAAPAWPASGVRYLASFVVEYGVWWWLLLAILAAAARLRRGPGAHVTRSRLARSLPIIVLLADLGYATLIVGGDYFEYRLYSVLIPLIFLSAVWCAARVAQHGWVVATLVGVLLLASYPIPWVHWLRTKDLKARDSTYKLTMPVANAFPWPLRPIVAEWDSWQSWLISRLVCVRHQEHKIATLYDIVELPSREEAGRIPWDGRNVYAGRTIGVTGWVVPNVAVIDYYGTNDRVIARHPAPTSPGEKRQMIHNRQPPEGYVPCFHANVRFNRAQKFVVTSRPLADEDIEACELKYAP